LRDRERACDAFRAAHPSAGATADNKALLRARYDAAKATADRVNAARDAISGLKAALEKARMDRALSSLSGGGEAGAGGDDAPLRAQMEAQKGAYRDGFEALRALKAEIEGIQRALEATRLRVQAEFEDWFAAAGGAPPAPAPAPASPPRHPAPAPSLNASFASSTAASVDSLAPPPHAPLGALPLNAARPAAPAGGGKAPAPVAVPARLGAPAQPPPPPPAAAQDGDVEDDIAAFYRLKNAAKR